MSDKGFINDLKEMEFFIQINENAETSPSLLWETFKALISGGIISFQASKMKKRKRTDRCRKTNQTIRQRKHHKTNSGKTK